MPATKILCGIDGSDTALAALDEAAKLAKLEGASLTIMHVRHHGHDDPKSVMARGREVAESAGVVAETLVVDGDPGEALLDAAEQQGADLLVLGNKGMTGVRRFLLGSIPNKVSHHARCDLLIVKTT